MNLDKVFLKEKIKKVALIQGMTLCAEPEFIGGGSFGKVYKAFTKEGTPVIFKAYYIEGMEKSEAYQLKILSENTDVPMPQVYFTFSDYEASILAMSFIEGKNTLEASFLLKSKEKKNAFAESVTDGMLQWHSVKGNKYGYLDNPCYDSWKDFYLGEKAEKDIYALKKLSEEGRYSKKSLELLMRGFKIFEEVAEEPDSPVLIHGDLNIMNIMAKSDDMSLTGFIDPCGSMWADREYDLFQLLNMWGNAYNLYGTYKEKFKVSEHCDFKVAFYGAVNENSMRLKGGIAIPLWEIQNNMRLKKIMKRY